MQATERRIRTFGPFIVTRLGYQAMSLVSKCEMESSVEIRSNCFHRTEQYETRLPLRLDWCHVYSTEISCFSFPWAIIADLNFP